MTPKRRHANITGKLALVLVCMLYAGNWCAAQLCTGSLGDPVVNITFGAGLNPGAPLAAATTNYNYTQNSCPTDGSYTVASSNGGCYADTWHHLHQDHTGNPNGYYMLVNASYQPGIFYLDTVRGLCGSTNYQFAAWILNLLKPNTSICGPTGIMPKITFSIEKLNGIVIQQYSTGDILPTDSAQWNQYGFYFTTQPKLEEVVIRITNNAPGGCGNDLAMDDITFRSCGPMVSINIAGSSHNHIKACVGNVSQNLVLNSLISYGYNHPAYQWERSIDSGKTWQDIPNKITPTLQFTLNDSLAPGTYLYRLSLAEAQNIGAEGCRVVSNIDTVELGLAPKLAITNNSPQCAGGKVVLAATGGGLYNWAGPRNFVSINDSVVITNVSALNAGTYYVTATSPQGCYANDSTAVAVISVVAHAGNDTSICMGNSVALSASGGHTYTWWPSSSLSASNIPNPLAAPVDTTRYFVAVGEGGCFDTAMVTVNIVKKPTVFSNSPVCPSGSIILAASNGRWYIWAGPGGFTATGDTVTITPAVLANAGEYYVKDSTNKVCYNTDSVTVSIGNPSAHAGSDTAICAGSTVQLNGGGNGSYNWQPSLGLSSATIAKPQASPTVTTTYVLTVAQNGCTGQDSATVTVINKLQASNNSPLCAGDDLVLQASGCNVCLWTGPAGFTASGAQIPVNDIDAANAGKYIITDTTQKVCSDTVSTDVIINSALANAGTDTTVCAGTQLQLIGSGKGTLSWQPPTGLSSPNIPNPILTAAQTMQYVLTASDSGCVKTDTVVVTVDHPVVLNAGPDKTIIQGESVVLDGGISDTGVAYYWSPNLYMENPYSITPIVHPPVDITYTLSVASGNVCGTVLDSVFVKVYNKVVIPNVFSPNGDGINDDWQIEALAAYTNADVNIFNRWGQPLFHSTGYARPWDGTYNGKPLPVATYYYVINLHNNMPVLSGWVAILR